jgi:hypothetical protein
MAARKWRERRPADAWPSSQYAEARLIDAMAARADVARLVAKVDRGDVAALGIAR